MESRRRQSDASQIIREFDTNFKEVMGQLKAFNEKVKEGTFSRAMQSLGDNIEKNLEAKKFLKLLPNSNLGLDDFPEGIVQDILLANIAFQLLKPFPNIRNAETLGEIFFSRSNSSIENIGCKATMIESLLRNIHENLQDEWECIQTGASAKADRITEQIFQVLDFHDYEILVLRNNLKMMLRRQQANAPKHLQFSKLRIDPPEILRPQRLHERRRRELIYFFTKQKKVPFVHSGLVSNLQLKMTESNTNGR